MKFLLDANAVIAMVNGHPNVVSRIRHYVPDDIGISAIVIFELYYGAHRSSRVTDNLTRLNAVRFSIVPFETEDARHAGEIRATLAAAGTPIGPYDLQIAGQARARGLILVTRNTREFKRVKGLNVEDWES